MIWGVLTWNENPRLETQVVRSPVTIRAKWEITENFSLPTDNCYVPEEENLQFSITRIVQEPILINFNPWWTLSCHERMKFTCWVLPQDNVFRPCCLNASHNSLYRSVTPGLACLFQHLSNNVNMALCIRNFLQFSSDVMTDCTKIMFLYVPYWRCICYILLFRNWQ
jgi:hypothetical protein